VAEPLAALGVWRRLVGAQIRSQLQYRVSFALETVGMFLFAFMDLFAILVIFHNVPQLAGWSSAEVVFLYGTAMLAFSLTDLVIGHLDLFPQTIRDGKFDLVLVRPRGTLLQVVAADFQIRRVGKIAQSTIVLVAAIVVLDIDWTIDRALFLPTMVVAGALIYGGVWVAAICVAFWTVEGREAANAFTYGSSFLAQYPINVYAAWLRRFFAFVIPAAFVSYFPSLHVLGKQDPLGLPRFLQLASPVVAIVVCVVAGLLWRFAVRHYRSTGS
jgi:ABC-2 type transport system permease protein